MLTNKISVMILAAGYGKRLNPLTFKTPKPLLKIGNESIIDTQIKRYKENKVKGQVKNDQVSLSKTSKIKASVHGSNKIVSDVRFELINKYRDILSNGSYVVKADELADKIVQKIRENKNRRVI